jgi:tetratricopeptide (TPR) repeat protein
MALPKRKPSFPDAADLAQIDALLLAGRLLDALTFARRFEPFEQWPGPDAQLAASRIVRLLGAPRRAAAMSLHVLRQHPKHCTAVRNVAFRHLERFGGFRAWSFLQENPPPADATAEDRADWYGALSCTLTVLRDFDPAEEALRKAQELDPTDPWLWVQECFLRRTADRFEDAVKSAETALAKGPRYPAALESMADALVLVGKSRDAIELLEKSVGPVQSPSLCLWLADRFAEQRQGDRALRYLRQFEAWVPLAEAGTRDALESRRAMVHHHAGRREDAAEAAGKVKKHGFYRKMAERLSSAPKDARRVTLDVEFIKQRHMYCAPATLAMLSTFFGKRTDQDTVADGITYDGTPAHKQREWAEREGWRVKEFTLRWDTATALIDRGIPFAITTVDVASSHLQAVAGYDAALRTVLIRDPSVDQLLDCYADALVDDHRGLGPRCFLMIPPERVGDLDGIELEDTEAYAIAVRVDAALEHADVASARDAVKALSALVGADHWLALTARYRVARADRDLATALALAEKLLAANPESPRLQQVLLNTLEAEGLESRRRDLLEKLCARSHPHPKFLQQLAEILRKDSRKSTATLRLLRRILATMPGDSGALWSLGTVEWTRGRYDVAAMLYRFASCLDPMKEGLARDYFLAARSAGKDADCERYLRRRWQRFGDDRGDTAATLSWALVGLGRADEAIEVFESAARRCPDDEGLKLSAARTCLQVGRVSDAKAWLSRIPAAKSARNVAEVKAMVAERTGDPKGALALWRELAETDPLDIAAQEQTARLLADVEGNEEAERYLEALVARHPGEPTLVRLLAEKVRYDSARVEQALLRLLALVPNDCWALNELAITAIKTGRFDEAERHVAKSLSIDAHGAGGHNIRAMLELHRGNPAAAIESAKRALHLNVDNGWALSFAFDAATDEKTRLLLADFVEGEIRAQSTNGGAIDSYCGLAPEMVPLERRLDFVRSLVAEQPDLYVLRRALLRLLQSLKRNDEARTEAEFIVRRWPSDADDWLTLASIRDALGDGAGKLAALERAVACAPLALSPLLALAQHYEAKGDLAMERSVLRRALGNAPFNALVYGYLADCDLREGKPQDAWPLLVRAVQLNPGYAWAWNTLRQLADDPEKHEKLVRLVRALAESRPRNTDVWLQLVDTLSGPDDFSERLAAIDRVLSINPLLEEGHTRRIQTFAEAGRHEEALAAARTGAWGARRRPASLRWYEANALRKLERIDEARETLEALVAESPEYAPGWRLLADVYEQTSAWEEYDRVARELVERFPQYPPSHGYYADSLRRRGQLDEARSSLNRALDLDSSYSWAAQLLWSLTEGTDASTRAAAIDRLRAALGDESPEVWEATLQAAIETGRKADAIAAMVRLCDAVPDRNALTAAATERLVAAGWGEELRAALEPSVRTRAGGAAAGVWAGLSAAHFGSRWPEVADAFLRGIEDGKAANWAATSVIETFGDAKDARGLHRFLDRAADFVHDKPMAWSMTGWALGALDLTECADRWLEGWTARELRSIELLYVSNAARDRERFDDALEAHRRAVALEEDSQTAVHWSWLAFELAGRGDAAGATHALAEARRRNTRLSAALLAQDVTELILNVVQSKAAGEAPSIRRAYDTLMRLGKRYAGKAWERYRVQILHRGFETLSRIEPGWWNRRLALYYQRHASGTTTQLWMALAFLVLSMLVHFFQRLFF